MFPAFPVVPTPLREMEREAHAVELMNAAEGAFGRTLSIARRLAYLRAASRVRLSPRRSVSPPSSSVVCKTRGVPKGCVMLRHADGLREGLFRQSGSERRTVKRARMMWWTTPMCQRVIVEQRNTGVVHMQVSTIGGRENAVCNLDGACAAIGILPTATSSACEAAWQQKWPSLTPMHVEVLGERDAREWTRGYGYGADFEKGFRFGLKLNFSRCGPIRCPDLGSGRPSLSSLRFRKCCPAD